MTLGVASLRVTARAALIFALGFFALVAQTLLFRRFMTAFEGNELAVGCFFGSWLVWVAVGAWLGRSQTRFHETLLRHFGWFALVYVPAFILQHLLLLNARSLAGVASFEMFPFVRMCVAASLNNAPISLATGLLFTLACRWQTDVGGLPVARVYILETLGSFAGGVVVTVLLAFGVCPETIFGCAALVLTLASATCRAVEGVSGPKRPTLAGVVRFAGFAAPLMIAALLACGAFRLWGDHNNRAAWTQLLPAESYRGAFATAQAEYLYGEREGQFVVLSGGGTCEALPNAEHASEVMALTLAQTPGARNVLVIGEDSLAVCLRFLDLPQVEHVTWLHPDPEYPNALLRLLPAQFIKADPRLDVPHADARMFLAQSTIPYDLVLLNLPDITTLVLNRYATAEFLTRLKGVLARDGAVAIRISGAENYIGSELIYLGASTLTTLESVFKYVVLKPGDETWLIASDGGDLTEWPARLRDRFAATPSAAALYPPEGLLSLYPLDRVAFQMDKYREVAKAVPTDLLLNSDQQPKALLYGLLLALRRAGLASPSAALPSLLTAGIWMVAAGAFMYGALRLLYRLRCSPSAGIAVFDSEFLVFSTGLSGMSLSVLLMFLYQSDFGALFLYIGLISSLFMLGSFAASLLAERVILRFPAGLASLTPVCLVVHVGLILAILRMPGEASQMRYAALFVLSGAFTGVYFPMVAHRLKLAQRTVAAAGSDLEMLDHLGGALGAVLTGLLFLPVLGTRTTLAALALIVAVNLGAFVARKRTPMPGEADWFDRWKRPAGYALLGAAAFALVVSQIAVAVQAGRQGEVLLNAAKAMSPDAELREEPYASGRGNYFAVTASTGEKTGYIFSTDGLAEKVYGYAGPIVLAVSVAPDGVLRDVRVIRSKETPVYLSLVTPWLQRLPGKNIFKPDAFKGVDGVSGATLSADAILKTLDAAGRRFASEALGLEAEEATTGSPSRWSGFAPDRSFVYLAALMAGAILLRYRPHVWLRRLYLATVLVVAGLFLNLQYSTAQVFSLIGGELPVFRLNAPFFLIVLVPVLVLLFGNVYCGHLCPFGALQELIGDLRPQSLGLDPDKTTWRYGRAAKYLLLALLVALFAVTRDSGVLAADPLITVFSTVRSQPVLRAAVALLALSVVFRRFWCRNLCPAGAFLALLNGVRLVARFMPAPRHAQCDLGVRSNADLDCILCDRCRRADSLLRADSLPREPVEESGATLKRASTSSALGGACRTERWCKAHPQANLTTSPLEGGTRADPLRQEDSLRRGKSLQFDKESP